MPLLSHDESGAITCEVCDEQLVLDAQLEIIARRPVVELVEPREPGDQIYNEQVVQVNGIVYVLHTDYRGITDVTREQPIYDLTAYASNRSELWRVDFGRPRESLWLVARPEGPYVMGRDGDIEGVTAFAPDGAIRWTAPPTDSLVPDGTGGAFASRSEEDISSSGIATATLSHIDALGATSWTRTFTATRPPGPYLTSAWLDLVRPTSEGVVVVGTFLPTLELGDQLLTSATPGKTDFVAVLDGAGAITWAVALGPAVSSITDVALLGDNVVLAGKYAAEEGTGLGLPPPRSADGFIARVTPAGATTAYAIGGLGNQSVGRLLIGSDDTIYFRAESRTSSEYDEEILPSQLEIAGRSFDLDEGGDMSYVLSMGL